ncbi:MAG: flagellar basal body P-ring formation chaperone FlgA [Pseudomonadota bacterium]
MTGAQVLPLLAAACLIAAPLDAQTVVANHPIPSRTVITELDVRLVGQNVPGAYTEIEEVVGLEARVTIYPGRPLRRGDLGPPALIERNQIVTLRYATGGLFIETDGRALDRAGVGDRLRVMNVSSRTTVTGRVLETGIVEVGR